MRNLTKNLCESALRGLTWGLFGQLLANRQTHTRQKPGPKVEQKRRVLQCPTKSFRSNNHNVAKSEPRGGDHQASTPRLCKLNLIDKIENFVSTRLDLISSRARQPAETARERKQPAAQEKVLRSCVWLATSTLPAVDPAIFWRVQRAVLVISEAGN